MKTAITELLGIKYPIIQGGMAWVAEYHLAAAVSEAGGLGLIGAASAPAEVVREQIRKAKELTDKPFGMNVDMYVGDLEMTTRMIMPPLSKTTLHPATITKDLMIRVVIQGPIQLTPIRKDRTLQRKSTLRTMME